MKTDERLLWISVLMLSILLSACSEQDKTRQFAMYATPEMAQKACRLVERDFGVDAKATQIKGQIDDYGCHVTLTKEEYERQFKFCYQSGINVSGAAAIDSFECVVQERQSDYLFLAHMSGKQGRESQVMCYFSCMVR